MDVPMWQMMWGRMIGFLQAEAWSRLLHRYSAPGCPPTSTRARQSAASDGVPVGKRRSRRTGGLRRRHAQLEICYVASVLPGELLSARAKKVPENVHLRAGTARLKVD